MMKMAYKFSPSTLSVLAENDGRRWKHEGP
jgi:hypothetical protein